MVDIKRLTGWHQVRINLVRFIVKTQNLSVNLVNRILNCVDKLTGKNWRRIYPEPIHTWNDTQWVSYVFTDAGDHYQVKHPVISTRFYANHTEFLDENFTKASISDERWAVEYLSGDEWLNACFLKNRYLYK